MNGAAWGLLLLLAIVLALFLMVWKQLRSRLTTEKSANTYLATECDRLTTERKTLNADLQATKRACKIWYDSFGVAHQEKKVMVTEAETLRSHCFTCRAEWTKVETERNLLKEAIQRYLAAQEGDQRNPSYDAECEYAETLLRATAGVPKAGVEVKDAVVSGDSTVEPNAT